jgi:hypothetical protein
MRTDRYTDRQTGRHTDRRTEGRMDMTQLIVAFRNVANAPVNLRLWPAPSSHVECEVSNLVLYILTFYYFNTRIVVLVLVFSIA